MKKTILYAASGMLLLLSSCDGGTTDQHTDTDLLPIEQAILNDTSSFYYIDFEQYGDSSGDLKIGVFDSGTGGLTVLDALVRFDEHDDEGQWGDGDGVPDFSGEEFIYLADQANMPYGNYYAADKSNLLIEHIIKDAQFLLSNKYYRSPTDDAYMTDKSKIKALVIACNTATAYGQEHIDTFMAKTGLDIPVIGVINAGSHGTLEGFEMDENASIGVFATVGTVASKGYDNTLLQLKDELGYTGDIQVFSQGGHGVAEAVDEEPDFIDRDANAPREDYRGPSLNDDSHPIQRTLMDVYNFDFDHDKMLCDTRNTDDCQVLQINSADNYVRYHLVSLLEKIRQSTNAQPLKAIVLGCTHYPYLMEDIENVLTELYHYQEDGEYRYREYMIEDVRLIDPAIYVARELYQALDERNQFNPSGDIRNSEFYISVPNVTNEHVQVDEAGRFPYDYKYGRNEGEIQEYVKVVPFDRSNIDTDIVERLRASIPETFQLMVDFNERNPKTDHLSPNIRIQ